MKKVLAILISVLIVLLALLVIVPVFFKDDILRIVQNQSSRYLQANLKIGDISLSMFRSFPDLNVSLKDVILTGQDEFAGDTVAYLSCFEASVNLRSLISGEEVIVNKILLKDSRLLPTVAVSGKANWDLRKEQEEEAETKSTTEPGKSGDKALRLDNIAIENLSIAYRDFQHSTYASIGNLTLHLKGNFSENNTLVDLLLSLENISYRHQNTVWVNQMNLRWQATIGADLKKRQFDIRKNQLNLNDLSLDLTGQIGFPEDRCIMDFQLNAPDTRFESLLALVPKAWQSYIQGLETSGDFKLHATARGEYGDKQLPAFQGTLKVKDASVKYPELPEAIRRINMDLTISNPGGTPDSTHIDLKKLSVDIAGNPFSMHLNITNPQNPVLDGGAKGVIDFSTLKKALPLKDMTLQGILTADMNFRGKYEYIEREAYEKFTARGSVIFQDILIVNATFPEGISIPRGSIVITPARLNLNNLQAQIYSSDFSLQGYLSDYFPYFFKNGTLKGDFTLRSRQINLNEFIIAQNRSVRADTLQTVPADSLARTSAPAAADGALEIPKNVAIGFTTDIDAILFDQLRIRQVKGRITLANGVANLKNLSMNMLNGSMVMNGQYNTANPQEPHVDFGLNISDFDIREAYQAFTFIRKSIPVAMNCSGKVSAAMQFAARLEPDMSPMMTTANGSGFLESKGILIEDNPAMKQLANVLKNDELSRLSISHLKINFKLENGNITVEPFTTRFAGNPVTIYGRQSVNGDLDYTLSMTVKREFFGSDINKLLKSVPGSSNIKELEIDAKVGGTLSKPVIRPDLSKAVKTVTKEAEKELKGNLLKGLQGLFKKK